MCLKYIVLSNIWLISECIHQKVLLIGELMLVKFIIDFLQLT